MNESDDLAKSSPTTREGLHQPIFDITGNLINPIDKPATDPNKDTVTDTEDKESSNVSRVVSEADSQSLLENNADALVKETAAEVPVDKILQPLTESNPNSEKNNLEGTLGEKHSPVEDEPKCLEKDKKVTDTVSENTSLEDWQPKRVAEERAPETVANFTEDSGFDAQRSFDEKPVLAEQATETNRVVATSAEPEISNRFGALNDNSAKNDHFGTTQPSQNRIVEQPVKSDTENKDILTSAPEGELETEIRPAVADEKKLHATDAEPVVRPVFTEPTGNTDKLYRAGFSPFGANKTVEDFGEENKIVAAEPKEPVERDIPELQTAPDPNLLPKKEDPANQALLIAEERAARNRSLGVVAPQINEKNIPTKQVEKLVTDKFSGAFGLFVLRLVVAAMIGIQAFQLFLTPKWLIDKMPEIINPYQEVLVLAIPIVMLIITVLLLVGLVVRVAGILLIALEAFYLAFYIWGPWPFKENMLGFVGQYELLLAVVGVLFLFLGGGGWSVDGSFRRARAAAKEEDR